MECIKFNLLRLVALVVIAFNSKVVCESYKEITHQQLQIIGSVLKTHNGDDYYAFRGIPYAKPPIDERRFKDPEPFGKWSGLLNATIDGNICPQALKKWNERDAYNMSEDCLNLNVYTKSLTAGNHTILIFIHGGGYKFGSGNSKIWNPKYLLDEDIVVVTFNYRLGALGHLATGDKEATGNYAFKDQVLVMKWVRDNIHHFGGDPKAVTLAGHSVGAMSATLHMISPMSRNLFRSVIAMSGSATSHMYIDNAHWTNILAEALRCPSNLTTEMMECLRAKPWQQIIDVCAPWEATGLADLKWNFEIEKDYGQEQFMVEHPSKLFKAGEFQKVPLMTGLTKDEFAAEGRKLLQNEHLSKLINEGFDELAPSLFGYGLLTTIRSNRSVEISRRLKQFYFEDQRIGTLTEIELENLFNDAIISHGVDRLVKLASPLIDVYYYRTDYKGRYTCAFYNSYGEPLYVGHSDDLPYLFVFKQCAPEFEDKDPEMVMVRRYVKYFTNFVKFGTPNMSENRSLACVDHWEPSLNGTIRTLYMNENCTMADPPYQDRFAVLDEMFPV